ncbi:MAG: Rec8 like protein-domain-containing protein [Benniella sp.]|nr:MAG: Rec8 like protein-domain-containing protein [Benniella sp.]
MFYSEAILSKKGPLAKVWLAAHWERKLTKNQLLQTNIHNSVDAIMGVDQAPMALRLSGQLLLGVSRIYSRKTKYLLEDCNEALIKIKIFDTNNRDNNLLAFDGNTDAANPRSAAAAFNAITVPDAMTEFDLLHPAHAIDISAWGLNPKTAQREMALDEGNEDDLLSTTGNYQSTDNGRRHLGLDIEKSRNYMNPMGTRGYNVMDFDLAGPDDALDLDMFGDDLGIGSDFDFMKRPHPRRDSLEIEVGRRDDSRARRSVSLDPFGMLPGEKQGPLHLGEGSEDGRALSVHGSVHDPPVFDDLHPTQGTNRDALHFDLVDGEDVQLEQGQGQAPPQNQQQPQQSTSKKRKLVEDTETEMSQEELMGAGRDLVANGLLTTHEMLPRSRKMLRLQQIEQDVARGGLAGYLLDFTAGPRVMGGALVPELASMFSRRLQLAPEAPAEAPIVAPAKVQGEEPLWRPAQVESWMDQLPDNEDADFGIPQTTPPPADRFDGFQLDSPVKERHTEAEVEHGEGSSTAAALRTSLFQEEDAETSTTTAATKQLLGTVFSTSTVQTMRFVQQGLEARRKESGDEELDVPARSTRTSSVATASAAANKGNTTRVAFSELMGGSQQKKKGTRTDAAKLFFELLVLSTKDVIKVEQEEAFGEIEVGGSPWLETLVEADANAEA